MTNQFNVEKYGFDKPTRLRPKFNFALDITPTYDQDELVDQFGDYCKARHAFVNQSYWDDVIAVPYAFHLEIVAGNARRFGYLLKNDLERKQAIQVAYGHDLGEDTRLSHNDIRSMVDERVANCIFACSDLRGKSRSERHGPEYWQELNYDYLAVYDKLCDILANATFSYMTNSSMYKKYSSEYEHLRERLSSWTKLFAPLFQEIEYVIRYSVPTSAN